MDQKVDSNSPSRTSEPRKRGYRLVFLLVIYILIAIPLLFIRSTERQSVFLVVLMIAPVMYAAFHYPRVVYAGMIVVGIGVGYAAQRMHAPSPYHLSVIELLGLGAAVGLVAEMVHRLVLSRDAVEQELRESEARYRLFVTRFQGVACQYDLQGKPFFLHGAVETITGYSAEDFLSGRVNWFDLVLADDLPGVAQTQELLRTLPHYFTELEYRVRSRDGRVRWVHEMGQNVCNAADKPLSILTAVYDVTAAHEAETALRASERRFRGLFDTMQEGFALYEAVRDESGEAVDFVILECNAAFERTFNLRDLPATGKRVTDVFPDLGDDWWQSFRAVLVSGQPIQMDGYSRRLRRNLEVRFYQPAPEQVVTITMDITERKQIEEALWESQSHFRSLFENSPVALWDEDFSQVRKLVETLKQQGVSDFHEYFREKPEAIRDVVQALVVTDVNRAAVEMAKVESKDAMLRNVSEVILSGSSDGLVEQVCAIAEGTTFIEWEGPNDMHQGDIRYHHLTWSVAPGAEQSYARVIVAIDDITDTKRALESLMYLSTHDTLTGLYNRAYFDTEIQRLSVGRTFPVALVFVDMDGLKSTNDQMGHAVGDEMLRRAASVLRSAFRAEDVVARIGGDEFGVLLPGAGIDVAQTAMFRVDAALVEHNAEHADGPEVCFSMGVATADKDDDLNEALKRADQDMYRVKGEKRRPGK